MPQVLALESGNSIARSNVQYTAHFVASAAVVCSAGEVLAFLRMEDEDRGKPTSAESSNYYYTTRVKLIRKLLVYKDLPNRTFSGAAEDGD